MPLRIRISVFAGHRAGRQDATATSAPVMSIASVQSASIRAESSRHIGAIRFAPIANSTPAANATRASVPSK